MDSSSIQLPGSQIDQVTFADGELRIGFPRAYLIKTMTGSAERTRWWQAGELVLTGVELEAPLPAGAAIVDGGDIEQNVYVYRDMIPVPLDGGGHCRCDLRLRDSDQRITAHGRTIRMELRDLPKYVEHLRD